MKLRERLQEEKPIDMIVAECGICKQELFHSHKGDALKMGINEAGEAIELQQRAHKSKTGHDDLHVHLDQPTPPEPVEYTVHKH